MIQKEYDPSVFFLPIDFIYLVLLGVIIGILIGLIMGAIYAVATLIFKADQGISGINRLLNTAAGAFTGYNLGQIGSQFQQ